MAPSTTSATGTEQARVNGTSSGSLKEQALASTVDGEPDFLLGLLGRVDLSVPAPKPAPSRSGVEHDGGEAGAGNPVLDAFSRYREAAGIAIQQQQEDLIDALAVPRCGPMSSEWQSALPGQESQLQSTLTVATEAEGEMPGSVYVDEHSDQGLVGCWQPGGLLQELLPSWLGWLLPFSNDADQDDERQLTKLHGHADAAAHMGFAESTFELPSRFLRGGGLKRVNNVAPAAGATGALYAPPAPPPVPSLGGGALASGPKKQPSHLDLPVHPRMRPQPLSAIQEDAEPYKFNSAIFAEVDMHGLEALGLELAGDLCPAVRGLRGQGRICRGHIRCGRLAKRVRHGALLDEYLLVTELALPTEADAPKVSRLSAALRERMVARDDVCAPLGATLARLKRKGDAVWIAWSDPVGAACKYSEAVCLAEVLLSHPPPDSEWRLATAERICEALAGIHAAGHSHGSLAPRSIWISRTTGAVSISDCGLIDALLASGIISTKDDVLQQLGVEFGRYVAPEVWQTRRPSGPAGDMYALGLVLMELLGEAGPPFPDCASVNQLAAKASFGHSMPLATARGSTIGQLPFAQHTIDQCLSQMPGARPMARDVLSSLAVPGGKYAGGQQDLSRASSRFDSTVSTEDLSDTRSSGASFMPAPRGMPAESTYDLPDAIPGHQRYAAHDEDWPFAPRGRAPY
mmetsp:Transcript_66675/g.124520  ORF Transcript_66675/g.124520 Transcript_66675/m.124520 type:complete len:688 (+) Transcript_66675:55-2118(+)